MVYFNLPIKKRFTRIFEGGMAFNLLTKFVEIDGTGIIVEYDRARNLILEKIKKDSCPIVDTNFILEADTLEETIRLFLLKKEARGKDPAIWIDEKKIIVKYPFCKFINRNRMGRFVCGPETYSGNGARGMCVLEPGISPPPAGYCPVSKKIDKTRAEKINVGGKEYFLVDASKI